MTFDEWWANAQKKGWLWADDASKAAAKLAWKAGFMAGAEAQDKHQNGEVRQCKKSQR